MALNLVTPEFCVYSHYDNGWIVCSSVLTIKGTFMPSDMTNKGSYSFSQITGELMDKVSSAFELQYHESRNEWGIVACAKLAKHSVYHWCPALEFHTYRCYSYISLCQDATWHIVCRFASNRSTLKQSQNAKLTSLSTWLWIENNCCWADWTCQRKNTTIYYSCRGFENNSGEIQWWKVSRTVKHECLLLYSPLSLTLVWSSRALSTLLTLLICEYPNRGTWGTCDLRWRLNADKKAFKRYYRSPKCNHFLHHTNCFAQDEKSAQTVIAWSHSAEVIAKLETSCHIWIPFKWNLVPINCWIWFQATPDHKWSTLLA